MSLYATQKFLFELNRTAEMQQRFQAGGATRDGLVEEFAVNAEERAAIVSADVGKLYVLGCNGQLLMHFAALVGMQWAEYIQAMRDGVADHGPVRAGIYAMTTKSDEKVAGV